jgi:hypothetical protein
LPIYHRSLIYEWFIAFALSNLIHNIIISISQVTFYSDSLDRLINEQVADELENYMEIHFNTELQDDSAVQVAIELLRFYQYCIEGNESIAKAEFDKLSPLQSWLRIEQPSQATVSLPIQHEDSSDEDMDVDKNKDEDEWTVVTRRRRK